MTMYCGEGVRIEKGLTLEELSESSSVPCSVLKDLESGQIKIFSSNVLIRISRALEVPVTELLSDAM